MGKFSPTATARGVMMDSGVRDSDIKERAEELLSDVFEHLLGIAQTYGITTKRQLVLLMAAQVRALENQGVSRVDIRPVTGLSAKTVRKLANHGHGSDETDMVAIFISDWASDADFPNKLAIDGEWPCFIDLCEKYGKDLTPAAISNALLQKGLAEKTGTHITLLSNSLISAAGKPELIPLASDALIDLISTITNNLSGNTPLMQRRLYTHRIPEENYEKYRADMKAAVTSFKDEAREILRKHEGGGDRKVDIGIGIHEFFRPSKR